MLAHVSFKWHVVLLLLPLLAPATVHAQRHFSRTDQERGYQVARIYDRQTDTTRVTYTVTGASRPFGLKSRVWIDLSFAYRGRQLTSAPESVTVTLVSLTPTRGGWAFAKPHRLTIACADSEKLRVDPARYERLPSRIFGPGRREVLSYRIHARALLGLKGEELLDLKAGQATVRFRQRRMAMLDEFIAQMKVGR